ncbi:serine hydrolase domain-containing protein, partial [Cellulomonas marina]
AGALALPLAVPLGAAPAVAAAPGPGTEDPTATARAVLEAARAAQAAVAAPAAPSASRAAGPAGPASPTSPAGPGDDAAALGAAVDALVAGGAVAVTARVDTPDGTWSDAAGTRELGGRAPAHDTDRFRVASNTKPMIATLVLQQVERGALSLGTRVEDVLPGLLPGHPEVTVEHLLSHRSGMPTGTDALLAARMSDLTSLEQLFAAMGQDYTDADHVAAALATPWVAEPGTAFSYSNAGYVVLGMLLERTTGRDLGDLLREGVFRPAGMRHSAFPDEPQHRGPFLSDAAWTGTQGLGWRSLTGFDPDVFGAAGAVTSTTRDLSSFTAALLSGRLVDPATVADMTTPRSDEVLEYGLGVYRVPDPCVAPGAEPAYLYGHDGASFGTLSLALSSPDGERRVTLGVTGRDLTGGTEPLYDLGTLLVPMLLSTC